MVTETSESFVIYFLLTLISVSICLENRSRITHVTHLQKWVCITLFKSITMLCGTHIILRNIPSFRLNVKNILQNTVSPTKHYYGFE